MEYYIKGANQARFQRNENSIKKLISLLQTEAIEE
jgi:hypothetical protein